MYYMFDYICQGFFLLHRKNIYQLEKVGDKLQKAITWFSLDWLQQISLQCRVDAYAVFFPCIVYFP